MLDAPTEDRLNKARDKILDAHRGDPNFTAAGIGYRRRAGQLTSEPAVVAMVATKRPEAYVSRSRLLPNKVKVDGVSVDVDVIQAGPFHLFTPATAAARTAPLKRCEMPPKVTERMRPLRAGCSIGPQSEIGSGTLGCFVRDNTDGTVCILSNRHVLGSSGTIVQPGRYDDRGAEGVATVKRAAPWPRTGTNVDAAIAQLWDQREGSGWIQNIAQDLIPPISADNPGVGLVTLGDLFGNVLMTRLDLAVQALNVTPMVGGRGGPAPGGPPRGVVAPEVGMTVEKVGRTTGYTSSIIAAKNVTLPVGLHIYKDLALCPFFGLAGDSGSVVLKGASFPCPVLNITGDYYKLDLQSDRLHTDRFTREFLSQTKLGQFVAQIPYLNSQMVKDRLDDKTGSAEETQAAQDLYDKYHDFLIAVLDDPNSGQVVTQEHIDDVAAGIRGLEQTVLTPQEAEAAWKLFDLGARNGLGKNYGQVQELMADDVWQEQVRQILVHVLCVVIPILIALTCPVLGAVGTYYNLPMEDDRELTDRIKLEFFAQTQLGQLLASLPYVNEATIRQRMNGHASPDEESAAWDYYYKYHDFMVYVLDDPASAEVVTQEHLDDAAAVIDGLGRTVLYGDETDLAWTLYYNALEPTLGMNRRQIIHYMDDLGLYRMVYDQIQAVPSIEVMGPITFPPGAAETAPDAWWKLDGNGADATAGNRPVTTRGGTSWISGGKTGGALRLSGGWADTAQPVVDTTKSFTVAAWARFHTPPPAGVYYDLLSQGTDPHLGFVIGALTGDPSGWFFYTASAEPNVPVAWVFPGAVHTPGQWVHLAGVYDADAGTIRIYIDGQMGPANKMAIKVAPQGGVQLGRAFWGKDPTPARYWPGDIDDVRVFAQALYPPRITDLAGRSPSATRLYAP